jgi:gamma-glutamyltranspeptidase/glutathione hydrolase
VNTSFGSKVVIPGTGLVLNNEMDDFSIQPGVPNAFGLVGSDQNAIAPGKRPLSSMSPTIVLREGRPVLTLGAAGGPKIITQVVIGLIRFIDLQQPLDEALAAPRWHHQWRPDRVLVEAELPAAVADALRDRGHVVEASTAAGVSQAIELRGDGTFKAVHDPRVPGASLMW